LIKSFNGIQHKTPLYCKLHSTENGDIRYSLVGFT